MNNVKNFRSALRSPGLVLMTIALLLLIVPGSPRIGKTAPRELTSGKTQDVRNEQMEGTWSVKCCFKNGDEKVPRHIQSFTIGWNDMDKHHSVRFDNENVADLAQFAGEGVTLNRKGLLAGDPDKQSDTQTWAGTLSQDAKGKLTITGKITGAGMAWLQRNNYDTRFIATKD